MLSQTVTEEDQSGDETVKWDEEALLLPIVTKKSWMSLYDYAGWLLKIQNDKQWVSHFARAHN